MSLPLPYHRPPTLKSRNGRNLCVPPPLPLPTITHSLFELAGIRAYPLLTSDAPMQPPSLYITTLLEIGPALDDRPSFSTTTLFFHSRRKLSSMDDQSSQPQIRQLTCVHPHHCLPHDTILPLHEAQDARIIDVTILLDAREVQGTSLEPTTTLPRVR